MFYQDWYAFFPLINMNWIQQWECMVFWDNTRWQLQIDLNNETTKMARPTYFILFHTPKIQIFKLDEQNILIGM